VGVASRFQCCATPIQRGNIEDAVGQWSLRQCLYRKKHVMRKVLRGYANERDGNLILIGTIPAPHSKDKASPRERQDKRHLIRQGATIFKKEIVH
jgi:hypothetical protein